MTRAADLAALRQLADARHRMVEQRMSALQRAEAEITAHLSDLDTARTDRAARMVGVADDAALRAGQDLVWQSWIDGRRSSMNADLARLAGQKDRLRAELARQFGRSEATAALHRAAVHSAQRDRDRRDPS